MSWYIHPSKQLREDELPPELVVTNSNGSVEQVYVPYRTLELGRGTCEVEESWHGESEMVEYRCAACDEYMVVEVVKPDGAQPPNYCPNCGRKVVDA